MGPFHLCEDGTIPPLRSGLWHQKSYLTQEANGLWEKNFWGMFLPVCRNGCSFFLDVRVGTCSVTPQWENTDFLQGIWGMVIWTVLWGSYYFTEFHHPAILSSDSKSLGWARIKEKKKSWCRHYEYDALFFDKKLGWNYSWSSIEFSRLWIGLRLHKLT